MCIINACASDASLIRLAPDSGLNLTGSKVTKGDSNDIVQKWALLLKVKLNRHLSSDPQNGNSELFFSNGFTRTHQDLPSIVHRIEQHRHFCRPISKLRRAFLDERRELIRVVHFPFAFGIRFTRLSDIRSM